MSWRTCASCGRQIRPRSVAAADAPGSVAPGTGDTCDTCMSQLRRTGSMTSRIRPDGIARSAQIEDFDVLVKVDLPRDHFRRLAAAAEQRETSVAVLIREIIRRQLDRPAPAAAPHREPPAVITREMRRNVRNLARDGYSDTRIADALEVPVATVVELREEQGLEGRPARTVAS